MENEIKIRKAFTETFIILNNLGLYNRLPSEFKKIIESNYDDNYKFSFNVDIPLFNQINNDITINLITYIYINYINKDNNINNFFKNEINDILNEMDN